MPIAHSERTQTYITINSPQTYQEFQSDQEIIIEGKLSAGPEYPELEIIIVNTQNWDTYVYRFKGSKDGTFVFTLFENIDEPSPGQWKASVQYREDKEYLVSTDNVMIIVSNDNEAESTPNSDSKIDAVSDPSDSIYTGDEVRNVVTLTNADSGDPIVGEPIWLTVIPPDLRWYEFNGTTDVNGQAEFDVVIKKQGIITLKSYWSGNTEINAYEYSWELEAQTAPVSNQPIAQYAAVVVIALAIIGFLVNKYRR